MYVCVSLLVLLCPICLSGCVISNQSTSKNHPVDTGRKLNVHKTFRRRPGHLLNVLCTLNLRPVPTGHVIRIKSSVN